MRRPAFTLLELVLAGAIGVMLMAALYVAVGYQYRNAQAGRDLLEQNLLARAVLTRMGNEIKLTVAPPAKSMASSSASTAAAATSTTATGNTSSGAGVVYNRCLQGGGDRVVFYLSRVPAELYQTPANSTSEQTPTGISDLRQVSYWLSGSGGAGGGLARRESKAVTSDDAAAAWTSATDDPAAVIAEEIQSLQLRYFDGTSWHDGWDATAVGADGVTPQGPPAAVEISIGVQRVGADTDRTGNTNLKYFTHRVAIPVANGKAQQTATITGQ